MSYTVLAYHHPIGVHGQQLATHLESNCGVERAGTVLNVRQFDDEIFAELRILSIVGTPLQQPT
jgi:hypothetical protein